MINKQPLVSIIVPIYNVERYLDKCVRSLFEQTYSNIEYIFVNDCSTDQSAKILDSLVQEYRPSNIKIINHPINKGLPSARNSGLVQATGEFVYHCDSDDWIDLKAIELFINKAIEESADIVYCDLNNVYPNQTIRYRQKEAQSYVGHLKNFLDGSSQGSVCNKFVKRSLYLDNNIKFPDGLAMLEDLRTTVQLYYYATKIVYLEEALYFYVKYRDDSIAGSDNIRLQDIRTDYIENALAIESFIKGKDIKGVEDELGVFLFGIKNNLLIYGESLTVFEKWRTTLPKSNKFIDKSNLPFYYKYLGKRILAGDILYPKLWLIIKGLKNKLKKK